MVVGEQSYETTEPTINSQIVTLHATGANVFFNVATPKFAAQAIKESARNRLETLAHSEQRFGVHWQRHEARRL